jgi:hypothetical protein
MARPFTRAQALENRAFLKALRRTGNVRLAAREVGVKYGTIQYRRKQHPGFAVKWDAALAFFQAWAEREKEDMGVNPMTSDVSHFVRTLAGLRRLYVLLRRRVPRRRRCTRRYGTALLEASLLSSVSPAVPCKFAGLSPANLHARQSRRFLPP